MRKPFIVRPTGLKGNEKLDRMRELMGASQLNEDVKNSVVELTKIGPDGKVYGIVREGHNYFIKVTDKKSNIVTEDFKYIGGLMNKTSEAYPTYAKAIKQLNLKFMSLNEAYGKQGNFNVFEDDNLLTEHHPYKADQKLSATKGMGDGAEYIVDKSGVELSYDSKEGKDDSQFGNNLADKDVMDEFEAVKLSENEMAIENMLVGEGDDWTEDEKERIADLTHQFMSNGDDYHYAAAWAKDAVRREREKNGKTAADLGGGTSINEESVSIAQQQAAGAALAAKRGEKDASELKGASKEMYDSMSEKELEDFASTKHKGLEKHVKESRKGFSIESALEKMDSIIGEDTSEKVTEILNSLTESEKEALLSTLKKKV